MATRLYVACDSEFIPGNVRERRTTMANILCQHRWNRPYDPEQDLLRCRGDFAYDYERARTILDNGQPDAKDVTTVVYKWDGSELVETTPDKLDSIDIDYMPFGRERQSGRSYTEEQIRETFGEDRYNATMKNAIRDIARYTLDQPDFRLQPRYQAWLDEHPEFEPELEQYKRDLRVFHQKKAEEREARLKKATGAGERA